MSFFTGLETWFVTTEADVVKLIANIKADIEVAISDVQKALHWLAGEVPTIVDGLNTAVGLAAAVGVVSAPELLAAHAAVAALDAFANVQNSTSTPTLQTAQQSVVAGYVAYQNANSAVAAAKATAASAPPGLAKKGVTGSPAQ